MGRVLIPLPLTGMETWVKVLHFHFRKGVLIPLPLTGMETAI